MGEAPKLDAEEALDVACRMIKRAAGAPIIVGVSAPGFAAMRSLARSVMEAGAAGVMIAPVPSLRTDDQIVGYFRQAVVRLSKEGRRDAAHDLFDAHLPLLRYEQQQGVGLAVRKYVMMRRGVIACDAQRKPGSSLSGTAKTEVDYLLTRLARTDKRAALKPRLAQAS
jgi:dihydrodipicolinate synthase/N-acetylneuraminate lyase